MDGIFAGEALLVHDALDASFLGSGDEDIHFVGAVFQHKEGRTTGNDAGTFIGNGVEDFFLGLKDVLYGHRFLDLTGVGITAYLDGSFGGGSHLLEQIGEPVLLGALQMLDAGGSKVESFFQRLHQLLADIVDIEFLCQFPGNSTTTGAYFTADRNYKRITEFHIVLFFGKYIKLSSNKQMLVTITVLAGTER